MVAWIALLVAQALPKEPVVVIGKPREYHGEHMPQAAYSPDGKLLAVRNAQAVDVWRLGSKEHWELAGPPPARLGGLLSFSFDGRYLASHSLLEVKVWEITAAGPVERGVTPIPEGTGYLWTQTLATPRGKELVASGRPQKLSETAVWETRIFAPLTSYPTHLEFSPDAKTVACASRDATVRLWDLTGAEPRETALLREGNHVTAVAWSPDGKALATSGWGPYVHVWDLAARRVKQTLEGHKYLVKSARFAADGTHLAALSSDWGRKESVLTLWDLASGRKRAEWTVPVDAHSMTLAPDRRHAAVVGENSVVYVFRIQEERR